MIKNQPISYYIILFLIYSFFGAVLEHVNYNIIQKYRHPDSYSIKALANPIITGFPIYGYGAFIVILLDQYVLQPLFAKILWFNADGSQISFLSKIIQFILKILILGLALTILEFFGGLYVGAGHQSSTQDYISTWDYSSNKYNFWEL